MATTTHPQIARPQVSRRAAAAATATAALVLACAAGLAVFTGQAPAASHPGGPFVPQLHAAGRGLLAGAGSYADAATGTSESIGYLSGKGGLMAYPGLELPVTEQAPSQARGGLIESADVR